MKRVFLSLFLSFVTSFCFLSPIHASWVDEGYDEAMKAAENGDVNSAAYISNADNNTKLNLVRQVFGAVEGLTVMKGDLNEPYAKKMNNQSAISGLSTYIGYMYTNPPASTYAFVQDMGQTLGFIPKQAYAQGIGFSGLSPLLPIWKMFRNISYAILALVMVAIGFMVMFRKKIDPKTVVTVQNALPKVVVTLILITFSYAIVGLMIDLMYIVLYAALQLIVTSAPSGMFDADHVSVFTSSSFGAVWKGMFGGFETFPIMINSIMPGEASWITKLTLATIFSGGVAGVLSILVALIMAIAFLFGVVRLFFMLLSAYIQIIVAVLIGPIQILLDAVPGGQGFSGWIKNLLSNLVVFPITSVMLTLAYFLIKSADKTWTPPLLGSGSSGISSLIGLGFLFIIPNTVKGLQEALKAKPMVNAGLGAIAGPMGSGVGQGMQLVYQGAMIKEGLFARKPNTNTLQSTIDSAKAAEKG
ncbi:MAG: hypothetical protein WAV51_04700 [Microgenomates group bacterium]